VTHRAGSRRELAALAAALLLPIPLLVASGLVLPLPSGVERGLVSLLPGLGDDGGSAADAAPPGTSTSSTSIRVLRARAGRAGTEKPGAGVLSEGGNAVAPAPGNGAADGDTRPADMLPGDQRRPPGGGDGAPPPSAAPDTTASPGPQSPGGQKQPDPTPVVQERVTTGVTVGPGGLQLSVGGPADAEAAVDVTEEAGISLTVDVSEEDTLPATTVPVPVTVPSLPLPPLPPLP
jgi:hypothetical protein